MLVSILVGYLSVTNILASYIEDLLSPEEPVVSIEDTTFTTRINEAVASAERYAKSAGRVLLDNPEFQRAATIASSEETPETPAAPITPDMIESALVNVYCQYKTDAYIRTTTGTGFFLNQKGIILTNAHVAQFLLLEGTKDVVSDAECTIRTGNPAVAKYRAELLYLSPTWILENAELIDNESPRGTGERDYALLYVTESLDATPLPTRFPTLFPDTQLLSRSIVGKSVLNAGYPAELLIRTGADAALEPVIAEATVGTLYTFGSNYADIFSVSDSLVGEQGASGGPVAFPEKGVIGLIVTKGDEASEGQHSLRALSLSYIDRTIKEETGFSLTQNMQGDAALRGSIFRSAIAPFLTQLLTEALQN